MDLTIDTCDSRDDAHSNYVEIKKESKIQKRINTARFNFYKVLENANFSIVTQTRSVNCLWKGELGRGRGGKRDYKGHEETLESDGCVYYFILVMVL